MPATVLPTSTDRLALVIGNAGYEGDLALRNPISDAVLITHTLQDLGFRVMGDLVDDDGPGIDLDCGQTRTAFGRFRKALKPGDTAIIYYAGHALQISDKNYLMPIHADLGHEDPLTQLVDLRDEIDRVANQIGPSGTVLVFLDACRDNPLSWHQMQSLGAQIDRRATAQQPPGAKTRAAVPGTGLTAYGLTRKGKSARMFIALATAPGEFAYDTGAAADDNSPFALALSRHLRTRGLELDDAYDRVSLDVRDWVEEAFDKPQEPWRESNLEGDFYMNPPSLAPIGVLALLGLVAGLVVSLLVFDGGSMRSPVDNPVIWGLGVPFGLVAAWGTLRWGSKRKQDAAFALLGPIIGFVLAFALMRLVPGHPRNPRPADLAADAVVMTEVFLYVSAFACLLFFIGTYITKRTNKVVGHGAGLRQVDHVLHYLLPILMLFGLLALRYLLTHDSTRSDPWLAAMGLHALAAGIIYAASAVVACKPQRSIFNGFGSFTGAVAVGILMAVFFGGFKWMTGDARGTAENASLALIVFATLWHGVLGAQLGYCFTHYVEEHERETWRGRRNAANAAPTSRNSPR